MSTLTHPNKSHPGTSGRKATLKDAGNWKAYLDKETHDFFIALGEGNFSAGIRKARTLLQKSAKIKSIPHNPPNVGGNRGTIRS